MNPSGRSGLLVKPLQLASSPPACRRPALDETQDSGGSWPITKSIFVLAAKFPQSYRRAEFVTPPLAAPSVWFGAGLGRGHQTNGYGGKTRACEKREGCGC